MRVKTLRFGEIEVDEGEIITFPEGLLGFAGHKRYVILEPREIAPLKWLQSVDEGWLAFVIVDPFIFKRNYEFDVPEDCAKQLGMRDASDAIVYVILTVDDDPSKTTANLQAPILISKRTRLAKQLILMNGDYDVRYPVLRSEEQVEGESYAHSGS
ncbi:TPA: flagellar assembly protein FliW [Candidatus Poribacteria bacterium]|nr:flagellar assembly protein FliW [Candidatus Poribacteria bacterium]HEX30366.1 flagellar assembly protein FliW [Candidatus Poribacteria bacterium]